MFIRLTTGLIINEPWIFDSSKHCVGFERVVSLVAQCCPVDQYVVHGRRDVHAEVVVVAEDIFVRVLLLVDRLVFVIDSLQSLRCRVSPNPVSSEVISSTFPSSNKAFFKKMGHPRPLFRLFSVFFKQTSILFYNKLM